MLDPTDRSTATVFFAQRWFFFDAWSLFRAPGSILPDRASSASTSRAFGPARRHLRACSAHLVGSPSVFPVASTFLRDPPTSDSRTSTSSVGSPASGDGSGTRSLGAPADSSATGSFRPARHRLGGRAKDFCGAIQRFVGAPAFFLATPPKTPVRARRACVRVRRSSVVRHVGRRGVTSSRREGFAATIG
jgi:hypothetical protein